MPKKLSKELTNRQEKVLKFIGEFISQSGYPPTMKEIGDALGFDAVTSLSHLRALERKGYIKREIGKPRAIELTEAYLIKMGNVIEIPIIGRVAAGVPLLAVENIDGKIMMDSSFVRGEKIFALRVKGDSMVEAHILNGDFVIVREQVTAEKGEIVVALIENHKTGEYEATVKKYYPENGCVRLQPCNKKMKPIVIGSEAVCKIAGKVIGVFRRI